MARPLLVTAALALLALAAPPAAAQAPAASAGRGDVRLGVSAGADSNAPRAFKDAGGEGPDPDLGLSLRASAEGDTPVADGRAVLRGVWDAGARTYLRYGEERTLAQAASAEGAWLLGEGLALGLGGAAKDRRGGARPYTDLAAGPFVDWAPGWVAGLDVRASVGARRFIYRPQGEASHAGPTAALQLRHRPAARHTLSLLGAWERQRHAGPLRFPPDGFAAGDARRVDTTWVGRAGWAWRGPVRLGVGYAFEARTSNSFGQRARTHRLNASAALRLPLRFSLLAQASLARSTYPDGVYLSPELVLAENDEGQDALSLRLVRALTPSLDLELTAGAWGTRLPESGLRYRRFTGALGLSWRPFAGREARTAPAPPPPPLAPPG